MRTTISSNVHEQKFGSEYYLKIITKIAKGFKFNVYICNIE